MEVEEGEPATSVFVVGSSAPEEDASMMSLATAEEVTGEGSAVGAAAVVVVVAVASSSEEQEEEEEEEEERITRRRWWSEDDAKTSAQRRRATHRDHHRVIERVARYIDPDPALMTIMMVTIRQPPVPVPVSPRLARRGEAAHDRGPTGDDDGGDHYFGGL